MKIITDNSPTSEITAIKVGDQISNGLGTFGQVEEIIFEEKEGTWHFTFALAGGGFIEATKVSSTC